MTDRLRRTAGMALCLGLMMACRLWQSPEPPQPPVGEPVIEPEPAPPAEPEPSEFELLMGRAALAAEAGDAGTAAAFLEQALIAEGPLGGREQALLQLAAYHGDPESPVYDADRACEELELLIGGYPETAAARVGEALLSVLEGMLYRDAEATELDGQVRDLNARVEELTSRLAEIQETLKRREQEMEKIKEILLSGAEP